MDRCVGSYLLNLSLVLLFLPRTSHNFVNIRSVTEGLSSCFASLLPDMACFNNVNNNL